jgi:uncharacterized protein
VKPLNFLLRTVRRTIRRSALSAMVVAMLSPVAATAQQTPPGRRPMVIASGVVTGLYYPMAGAICRQVNQERMTHGYHCLVEATGGPVQNLNALRDGDADMAIIQSDWQAAAYRGEGRFAGAGAFADLRAVATLHPETVTLLVRPEAGIEALAGLKGKRVNLGPRGSALRNLVDTVLDAAGVRGLGEGEEIAPDEALQALCDGDLDAAFFAVGHPNAAIHTATAGCGAVAMPITGEGIDKLLASRPDMVRAAIPASVYSGIDEDVPSIGVAATLVVRAGADDAMVAEVTRVLLERRPELADQHPVFQGLEAEGMADRGRTAPLHPAAEKVFAAARPAAAD